MTKITVLTTDTVSYTHLVTYDITPYLREGENDLLIWLGQGWYLSLIHI